MDPRLDLERYSYGFDWGHGGPGADQLALAMLADAVGDEVAQKLHQAFKWVFLATLVGQHFQSWEITRGRVRRWIREQPTLSSARL